MWLKQSNKTVDKKQLASHMISNHRTMMLHIHLPGYTKCQICQNWTNEHFFSIRNCCYVQFWSLNFVILLSLRDTHGDRMCGNEIKQ